MEIRHANSVTQLSGRQVTTEPLLDIVASSIGERRDEHFSRGDDQAPIQ